jgi:hypothetical protein
MKCSLTLEEQLLALSGVQAGWLDGEGLAISTLTLMETGRRVREHLKTTGIMPFLYPTEDGGVSAEWDEDGGGHFKIDSIAPLLTATQAAHALRDDDGDDE